MNSFYITFFICIFWPLFTIYLIGSLSGVCAHPQAELESCQKAGDLLTAGGQYLTVKYKKCAAVRQSYDAGE